MLTPNAILTWATPDFMKEDGVLSLKKCSYCAGVVMSIRWLTTSLAHNNYKPDAQWVLCFQWFLAGTVLAYVGGKAVDKWVPGQTTPAQAPAQPLKAE